MSFLDFLFALRPKSMQFPARRLPPEQWIYRMASTSALLYEEVEVSKPFDVPGLHLASLSPATAVLQSAERSWGPATKARWARQESTNLGDSWTRPKGQLENLFLNNFCSCSLLNAVGRFGSYMKQQAADKPRQPTRLSLSKPSSCWHLLISVGFRGKTWVFADTATLSSKLRPCMALLHVIFAVQTAGPCRSCVKARRMRRQKLQTRWRLAEQTVKATN